MRWSQFRTAIRRRPDHRRSQRRYSDRCRRCSSRPVCAVSPSRGAVQPEGSKSFTGGFLARYAIPTADYRTFTEVEPALASTCANAGTDRGQGGRPGGRQGATVATDLASAENAEGRGYARRNVSGSADIGVDEEYPDGEGKPVYRHGDGRHVLPDGHQPGITRVGDGDTVRTSSGMGVHHCRAPGGHRRRRIMDEVIMPTIAGMGSEGLAEHRVLHAGLMIAG